MKHGWEYKKLGEVSEIVGGSTPKTSIDSYWGGEYPWVTPAELNGAKYIDKTERTITDEALAHTNLQLLPVGTVLLSSRAPIGKLAITKIPMYCNQGFKNIIPGDSLYNEFAYWYLTYKKDYIISLGRGATFKEISKSITEKIPIPIPPLGEQKAICSLLDKLSLVIEKKKQQVKELDNLAQAIFYDMFGDPVENEKGFAISSLNDICELITDGTHQTPTYTEDTKNGFIFLSAKNVVGGFIDWTNVKYIPKELHTSLYARLAPRRNDILLCKNGTTGIAAIVETDEVFDIYVSLGLLRLKDGYLPKYILYAINNPYTKQQFDDSLKGVGVPNLHLGEIKKARIIIPPLSLQQDFSVKVEFIERQKELINKSIAEVQTLFDSQMEYYFGE